MANLQQFQFGTFVRRTTGVSPDLFIGTVPAVLTATTGTPYYLSPSGGGFADFVANAPLGAFGLFDADRNVAGSGSNNIVVNLGTDLLSAFPTDRFYWGSVVARQNGVNLIYTTPKFTYGKISKSGLIAKKFYAPSTSVITNPTASFTVYGSGTFALTDFGSTVASITTDPRYQVNLGIADKGPAEQGILNESTYNSGILGNLSVSNGYTVAGSAGLPYPQNFAGALLAIADNINYENVNGGSPFVASINNITVTAGAFVIAGLKTTLTIGSTINYIKQNLVGYVDGSLVPTAAGGANYFGQNSPAVTPQIVNADASSGFLYFGYGSIPEISAIWTDDAIKRGVGTFYVGDGTNPTEWGIPTDPTATLPTYANGAVTAATSPNGIVSGYSTLSFGYNNWTSQNPVETASFNTAGTNLFQLGAVAGTNGDTLTNSILGLLATTFGTSIL